MLCREAWGGWVGGKVGSTHHGMPMLCTDWNAVMHHAAVKNASALAAAMLARSIASVAAPIAITASNESSGSGNIAGSAAPPPAAASGTGNVPSCRSGCTPEAELALAGGSSPAGAAVAPPPAPEPAPSAGLPRRQNAQLVAARTCTSKCISTHATHSRHNEACSRMRGGREKQDRRRGEDEDLKERRAGLRTRAFRHDEREM
eukprot:188944-Chlamydomonas_euryale.AAC.7